MKNIHLIPTDKPSRFSLNSSGKYHLTKQLYTNSPNFIAKHIYITSNEEIKDIRPYKGKWQLEQGLMLNKFPTYLTDLSECKLVIMTTDQELINDGVQAIDDEFLEWFVKNPSCEKVEIEVEFIQTFDNLKDGFYYKIIIPKEEQKQHLIDMMRYDEELGLYEEPKQDWYCPKCDSYVSSESVTFEETHQTCNTGVVIKEPKKETLEEAAEKQCEIEGWGLYEGLSEQYAIKNAFIEGAKLQSQRMYSEEEVFNLCRAFATFVAHKDPSYKKQQEWFEQFKKK